MRRIILGIGIIMVSSALGFAGQNTLLPAGEKAPSFSLPGLDGKRLSLYELCGDVLSKPYLNKIPYTVVLSFWATYCIPCQKEMPQLQLFAQKHLSDSVKVLCVSIDAEGGTLVEPFVTAKKYSNTILLDQYKKTAERYGVKSLPALFVIDRHGVIRFSALGYDEKNELSGKLEQVVADVKANKVVEPAAGGVAVEIAPVKADSGRADSIIAKSARAAEKKTEAVPPAQKAITPHQKWHAVARIEMGDSLSKVAADMGVSAQDIRGWSEELKKAALSLWSVKDSATLPVNNSGVKK
ncbi:MAG: redoxin domain-containing protein [Chitinivibrionales bacterium]|nr:redoxin domain-containing protein [Chitinivibrionales bacterium]